VVDLWRAASEWKGLEEHNRKDRTAGPIVKSSLKVWKWKWRYVFGIFCSECCQATAALFGGIGADRVVLASWPRNSVWKIETTYFDWISTLMFDLHLAVVVFQYLVLKGFRKWNRQIACEYIERVSSSLSLLYTGLWQGILYWYPLSRGRIY